MVLIREMRAEIAELEKKLQAEDERETRLLKEVAGIYEEQEETLAPIPFLLSKIGLKPDDINEYFKAQENEARRMVEVATPRLQLTNEELEYIDSETRAVLLINPCGRTHHSPPYICIRDAAHCSAYHWTYGNASASCQCDIARSRDELINPKAIAYGQAATGLGYAYTHCRLYFNITPRSSWTTVQVDPWLKVHGFHITNGSASIYLKLEAKGYQYGHNWAGKEQWESWHGNTMGRYDVDKHLWFEMPVGPDPWYVLVSARLWAFARGGGSSAVGDFATGVGNVIKAIWVNTWSSVP